MSFEIEDEPGFRQESGLAAGADGGTLPYRLFVPAGVGIMVHAHRIGSEWMPIVIALVVSTWVAIAVTALVTRALMRRPPPAAQPVEAADAGAQP